MKKSEKKELQQDRFLILVDFVIKWHSKNRKKVIVFIAAVFLAIVVAALFQVQRILSSKRAVSIFVAAISVEEFKEVIEKYPDSEYARAAYMRIASILYAENKFVEAKEYYEKFAGLYPKDFLAAFALIDAGYCLENADDLKGAIKIYETLSEKYADTSPALQAGINAARCYEQLGEFTSAIKIYKDVMNKAPFSLWARESERHIGRIEAEGLPK